MWVESQGEFSIAYVKQALQALKRKKHWSRVIQVALIVEVFCVLEAFKSFSAARLKKETMVCL